MSKKKDISLDSQIERLQQRNRDPKVQADRLKESFKEYLCMLKKLRELQEQQEDISGDIDDLRYRMNDFVRSNPALWKCPSCGGKMDMESDDYDRFYFSCEHCYLTTPCRDTEEEAYFCLLMFKEMFENEGVSNE